jgi:hypothetical protein
MLAYTLFVLIRFSRHYCRARHESRTLVHDSWRAFQRSQRTIVAALSRGLLTLKAIPSAAPFLGLAGTSYGILASLSRGFGMEKNAALRILTLSIAARVISAAAGILVAIPAMLAYNFLRTRIDRFERECLRAVPAGMASHGDQVGLRQFRLAQTLPLKKRFSSLPPFGLIAAPALAGVVMVFMAFEPYETPTGLDVRLLPINSLDGDRLSLKPVVIAIVVGANGSPVIRVNFRETPPNNLEEATRRELKLIAEPRVFVEAESTIAWADVTNVIDIMQGLNAEVFLLTATPDATSRYTQRSASP